MSLGERTNIVRVTTATAATCNAIIIINIIIRLIFLIIHNDRDATLYSKLNPFYVRNNNNEQSWEIHI